MRVGIEHQSRGADLRQAGVVGQQYLFVGEWLEGMQDAIDDRDSADVEQRLVGAVQARGAAARENERRSAGRAQSDVKPPGSGACRTDHKTADRQDSASRTTDRRFPTELTLGPPAASRSRLLACS